MGTYGSAIYGQAGGITDGNWAGFFEGSAEITGATFSSAFVVLVDNPIAPAERFYRQALVGSFEQLSIISGNAVAGANGRVTVKVPTLFARFHTDVRYQLTALGPAQIYVAKELDAKGRFTVASDVPGVRISWQLTGVRSDPAALKRPLRVDAAKPAHLRGRYVQPALYGQPRSKSLLALRNEPRRPKS